MPLWTKKKVNLNGLSIEDLRILIFYAADMKIHKSLELQNAARILIPFNIMKIIFPWRADTSLR